MALTKEDIETAIAQTENQDEIRHSLSNYFEGLDEPVAVAIGIGFKKDDHSSEGENRDPHPENVDKVVDILRGKGINAVSFLDPAAADSSNFVVTTTGVMCPFMSPKDAIKATVMIENVLLDSGYNLVGHANPQSVENILYASELPLNREDGENVIDLKMAHPDQEKFAIIESKYGGDYKGFIDKKITEAYTGAETVIFSEMDKENVYVNGMESLFRGGTLGANPYAVISGSCARKVAHSSPAISICSGFSGKGKSNSSRGGAVYEKTLSNLEYGFIYKMSSLGDEQKFYPNVGLETAWHPKTIDALDFTDDDKKPSWDPFRGEIYETPVLPHHNKVEAIYLYLGSPNSQFTDQQAKLYAIPLDESGKPKDEEWRDFLALHEPTDSTVRGFLAIRQNAQKTEQTQDKNHAYSFELSAGLSPDNQQYLENMNAEDFVRIFNNKGDVIKDGQTVSVNGDLHIRKLKLAHFPDLSAVHLSGALSLNSNSIERVDIRRLPVCEGGVHCSGTQIEHVNDIDSARFLSIIGAKEVNGWYNVKNITCINTMMDSCPQGFEKVKFRSLPMVSMPLPSFEYIPETQFGIGLSTLILKDQSSIETMPAKDFIYKVAGNLGTDPYAGQNVYLEQSGIKYTDIKDTVSLDLYNTNIVNLPSEMKDYKVGEINFNPKFEVSLLDNFPITQKGISYLNFHGDLNKETMESFLLKTRGEEWVSKNTTKADDGHLIINGNFNLSFKDSVYNITSFPKDVLDVEFRGEIEPLDFSRKLQRLKDLEKEKESEFLSLRSDDVNTNLSEYKTKKLYLDNYGNSVVLPQNLEELNIENSENIDISKISKIPSTLKTLYISDVVGTRPLDLSFMENELELRNSHITQVKLPQSLTFLTIDNVQVDKPINIANIEKLNADSMIFPKGSVIDLSESKSVRMNNCSFAEGTELNLSHCERVELSDIDLSKVNVIMPKEGRVIINENVKFAPDYKLDLSKCADGYVDPTVSCGEIKLPQSLVSRDDVKIPSCVKEITTSFIYSSLNITIPSHVKIIDVPDEQGKKISLKYLKKKGLSKEQIATLRKERLIGKFRGIMTKVLPINPKIKTSEHHEIPSKKQPKIRLTLSDKDKSIVTRLSGRNGSRSGSAVRDEKMVPEFLKTSQITTEQPTSSVTQTAAAAKTEPVTDLSAKSKESLPQRIAEMSKEKLGKFVSLLRKGYNSISGEGINPTKPAKTVDKTNQQTNAVQASAINMQQNSGNSGR